jgi:hypothetical protein
MAVGQPGSLFGGTAMNSDDEYLGYRLSGGGYQREGLRESIIHLGFPFIGIHLQEMVLVANQYDDASIKQILKIQKNLFRYPVQKTVKHTRGSLVFPN